MGSKGLFGMMAALVLTAAVLSGCGGAPENSGAEKPENAASANTSAADTSVAEKAVVDRESLYQVSLLQDLTQGDYYGSVSVGELKKKGVTGLGTFNKLNSSGWHFHFISDDGTMGGHIVDLALNEGEVKWDKTTGLDVDLPEEERFRTYDFSTDQSEDVEKVEKPKG